MKRNKILVAGAVFLGLAGLGATPKIDTQIVKRADNPITNSSSSSVILSSREEMVARKIFSRTAEDWKAVLSIYNDYECSILYESEDIAKEKLAHYYINRFNEYVITDPDNEEVLGLFVVNEDTSTLLDCVAPEDIDSSRLKSEKSKLDEIIETYLAPAVLYGVANIVTFITALVAFLKKLKGNTTSLQSQITEIDKLKKQLSETIEAIAEVKKAVEQAAEEIGDLSTVDLKLENLIKAFELAFSTNCGLIQKGMSNYVVARLKGETIDEKEPDTETENQEKAN